MSWEVEDEAEEDKMRISEWKIMRLIYAVI